MYQMIIRNVATFKIWNRLFGLLLLMSIYTSVFRNIFCGNLKEAGLQVWEIILLCETSNHTESVLIPLCCLNSHIYRLIRNILEAQIVLHDKPAHRITQIFIWLWKLKYIELVRAKCVGCQCHRVSKFCRGSKLTKILWFQSQKKFEDPPTPAL